MESTPSPSHLRYGLRSGFWIASSIVCLVFGHSFFEAFAGVNMAPISWARIAVVLVPLVHTGRVGRRPELDTTWVGTLRSCGIGVGIGTILDLMMAFVSHSPASAVVDALQSAVLVSAAILLPRLALRPIAPGIFGKEASIEGFRDHRGRRWIAHLLAVLAAVGVLVAMAVPNFKTFGLRAKAGETRSEIEAIREAEEAWYSEHGHYLKTTSLPLGPPGLHRVGFDSDAHAASGFERLGWPTNPKRELYCRYAVGVGNPEGTGGYTIETICDIDGDGEQMAFGWLKRAPGSRVGVPGPFGYCTIRGVLPERGARGEERLFEQFGPCDATSSVSRF